jgi:predicted DNA-binding protein (UPF0251 family)
VPRPKKIRYISIVPVVRLFKPQGIPVRVLERVPLELDEFEALRLADCLSLSHHKAAERMRVSRATFSRIVAAARHKVADALMHGKAIVIMSENLENKTGLSPQERRPDTGKQNQGLTPGYQ